MGQPGRIVDANGVDMGFSAPGKWCRHKEQFRTWSAQLGVWYVECSNCGSEASGTTRQLASDALMKIEAEGAVTETSAP